MYENTVHVFQCVFDTLRGDETRIDYREILCVSCECNFTDSDVQCTPLIIISIIHKVHCVLQIVVYMHHTYWLHAYQVSIIDCQLCNPAEEALLMLALNSHI